MGMVWIVADAVSPRIRPKPQLGLGSRPATSTIRTTWFALSEARLA